MRRQTVAFWAGGFGLAVPAQAIMIALGHRLPVAEFVVDDAALTLAMWVTYAIACAWWQWPSREWWKAR